MPDGDGKTSAGPVTDKGKIMTTKPFIKTVAMAAVLGLALAACTTGDNGRHAPSACMGMYSATLPCADCPGIVTHVSIEPDHTAAVTRLYLDSDNTSETNYGRWTYQDGRFTVTTVSDDPVPDTEILAFITLPENRIALADDDNGIRENYIFDKAKPMTVADFTGTYRQGDTDKGAYGQNLVIAPAANGNVSVSITQTGGKGKGCDFRGEGRIVNDQIEVKLKTQHPGLDAVMVIRPLPEGNGLNVFSSKFDQRYDLMYFCGGGGTLAGDYVRQTAPR